MSELAWPFVALVAVGCLTWLADKFVPSRNELDALFKSIGQVRVVAEYAEATAMASAKQATKDLAEDGKAIDELKQRLSKLEMSRLGRAG
jgi:hypothetical protein